MKETNMEKETTSRTEEQAPAEAATATAAATVEAATTTTPGDDNANHGTNDSSQCLCCRCSFFAQVPRREWMAMFFTSLVALILCDAATDVCGFLEATVFLGHAAYHQEGCDSVTGMERRGIGINVYEDEDGECVSWRKGTDKDDVYHERDDMWKAVRYLVGIASVVSLLLVIALGCSACVSYPRSVWRTMAVLTHLVWVLYSLAFMLFGADVCQEPHYSHAEYDDCTFDTGAWLMLVGVLVWMPASLLVWRLASSLPKRTTAGNDNNQDEEVSANNNHPENPNDQETEDDLQDVRAPEEKCRQLIGWVVTWAILLVMSIVVNVLVITLLKKGEKPFSVCVGGND
uniref:Uncharacterized protein n=1 Tax=Amphora coffeiformis TaxID=265554 RepID=A0A7S3L7Y6_9STRA|mmetsp:Transcript_10995/g.20937  ORF Transcript_10995/g.20937 Transcript_10995/m.20937 type:complete len:345 (+) Transcript_10995:101-1135(+)